MGRLDSAGFAAAKQLRDDYWAQINVTEVDEALIQTAAEFAEEHALRGYDAVHCAAAAQVADTDLVAASGDRKLLTAWKELGVATFDTNTPEP